MADLADVVNLLGEMSASAAYPNGTSQASVINAAVKVVADWPLAADVDAAMAANTAIVSVYPTGGNSNTHQIVDDLPYIVTPAVHGLTAAVSGQTVTLSGTPGAGEFASIIVNKTNSYSHTGASAAAILAAIASDAAAAFPGVSAAGNAITWPSTVHSLVCRIGATATAGRVTHRQKAMIRVTVWASTPGVRDTLAAAVDVALKQVNRLTMPDGTQAIMAADHSMQVDERQTALIYRRDMIFNVEYATTLQYPVVEITTFGMNLDLGFSSYGHVADDAIVG